MKKLVSAFAAFTMMLALPTVAMAAQFNSPSGTTVTAPGTGVAISVSGDVSGNGFIHVDPSDAAASNVPEGVTPLASFEVVADDNVSFTELSLTFSVGSKYAGAKATVYIQHGDGTTDVQEATVAAVRESCPFCQIMVGGAVVTQEFADQIGADFYGKDAAESAKVAGLVLGR